MSRIALAPLAALMLSAAWNVAQADDSRWYVDLQVFRGSVTGLASPVCRFGVQPGATDGFDAILEEPAPPHGPGEWIQVAWLRPTWDPPGPYLADWRAAIPNGLTKTWPTLVVESSSATTAVLRWTIGGVFWPAPGDYVFTLYDEGVSPDPTGGAAISMAAPSGQYSFGHAGGTQRRYFHVVVNNPPTGAPPTCDVTYSPAAPTRADLITFDSQARDSDGSVTSVAWSFGDGGTGSGIATSHQYAAIGSYDVCATVTDNDGNVRVCCTSVVVANAIPNCTFTFEPVDPICTDVVQFTANGADPDGTVVGYAWDFGDGSVAEGQSTSHQFAVGADYDVVCTVTDNDGATATCVRIVFVLGPPPQACFTEDIHEAQVGQTISFDAGCTPDPCATLLAYDWDFGDGDTAEGTTTSHAYAAEGTYTVSLTVYDIEGRNDTAVETKVISSGTCLSLAGDRWYLLTLPCQASDPDPWQVFDELRPPNQALDLLSGNLHRYDPIRQGYVTYFHEAPTDFGPIVPGVGYWLYVFDAVDICYVADCGITAPQLHFDTRAWHLIGWPQNADVAVADTVLTHNGIGPDPFAAHANEWLQDPIIYYDGASYQNCGLYPQDTDDHFRAFAGYWVYTFVDDVTLGLP
jgi:PKD repeat protein